MREDEHKFEFHICIKAVPRSVKKPVSAEQICCNGFATSIFQATVESMNQEVQLAKWQEAG